MTVWVRGPQMRSDTDLAQGALADLVRSGAGYTQRAHGQAGIAGSGRQMSYRSKDIGSVRPNS